MPIRLILLVLGVAFSLPALAQTPSRPPLPAQYVKTRLAANPREQKAVADALKDIQRRGQDTLSRNVRGTSPRQVLTQAAGILEEEGRTLAFLKKMVDGKPIGGDPRANIRQATLEGVRAFNQSKYAGEQQAEAGENLVRLAQRPGLTDAVEYQRLIIGLQTHVVTAAQHLEETIDVYLSALGGRSIADTLEAQRIFNARVEMQRRARRAREEEAAAAVLKVVGGATLELVAAVADSVAERNNVSMTDVGTGWRGAKDAFQADGLDEGGLLRRIHDGDFAPLAGDLKVHFALESYVVRFSDMCRSKLASFSDVVELEVIHTEELITKNLLQMELSRITISRQREKTGVFATKAFADALLAPNMSDNLNILAILFGGSGDSVPILGGTAKLARMSTGFRRDFRRLIARHGCDGAVLTRLSDNLLRSRQRGAFGE